MIRAAPLPTAPCCQRGSVRWAQSTEEDATQAGGRGSARVERRGGRPPGSHGVRRPNEGGRRSECRDRVHRRHRPHGDSVNVNRVGHGRDMGAIHGGLRRHGRGLHAVVVAGRVLQALFPHTLSLPSLQGFTHLSVFARRLGRLGGLLGSQLLLRRQKPQRPAVYFPEPDPVHHPA